MIAAVEPERGWYAGGVGWMGPDGQGTLAVALRCGLLAANSITLFAGAGIVADSEPHAEWRETLDKARFLLDAARNAPPHLTVGAAT